MSACHGSKGGFPLLTISRTAGRMGPREEVHPPGHPFAHVRESLPPLQDVACQWTAHVRVVEGLDSSAQASTVAWSTASGSSSRQARPCCLASTAFRNAPHSPNCFTANCRCVTVPPSPGHRAIQHAAGLGVFERRSTTALRVTPDTPERLFFLRIAHCARRDMPGCCARSPSRYVWAASKA